MIEVENTDVNIVRNLIPMRNLMPASAYGLKAISDWLLHSCARLLDRIISRSIQHSVVSKRCFLFQQKVYAVLFSSYKTSFSKT